MPAEQVALKLARDGSVAFGTSSLDVLPLLDSWAAKGFIEIQTRIPNMTFISAFLVEALSFEFYLLTKLGEHIASKKKRVCRAKG